ncbi:MAG TPA: FecR domain-containing protein [Chitinophagaceae bacterium]
MDNGQTPYDIKELAEKWRKGTITPAEKAYYEQWYAGFNDAETRLDADLAGPAEEIGDRIYQRLEKRIQPKVRKLFIYRITAAASILLVLSVSAYFAFHKKAPEQVAQVQAIAPGRNQATLILANGRKIILTKGLAGQLATQGTTAILAKGENGVNYVAATNGENKIQYNTLSTGRGEMSPYPLTLADGTRIWLNAASSVTFPTVFPGKSREVSITGEAYFEVAHNSAQPFRVRVKNQTVEDIGTHFNINAYDDEPVIKTTLIEGAVKVGGLILKPGQQTDGQTIRTADLAEAMAWKNGLFRFNHQPLEEVMRQAMRWYNIEVEYDDPKLKTESFGGVTTRFANISELLHTLELTHQVRFSVTGKKITVHSY